MRPARTPGLDRLDRRREPRRASLLRTPRVDWVLMAAVAGLLVLGTLLVWSATEPRDVLTGGDPTAYLKKQLVNVAIGVVLMLAVLVTDHRWVRIVAPLVYLGSILGLVLVLTMGSTINGSRSWLMLGGMSVQPSEFAKLTVVVGMALLCAERADWSKRGRAVLRGARDAGDRGAAGLADPAAARPRARCWCSPPPCSACWPRRVRRDAG